MYKLLLILKYLSKRRIAWAALAAVMLCTAMVLVVISVMGGWLNMFRQSFHGMSGDVIVRGESLTGFPHYQQMLRQIRAMPEIKAAEPVIRSFGLINVHNEIRRGVQVIGFTDGIGQVNRFAQSLHRRPGTTQPYALRPDVAYERYRPLNFKGDVSSWPGMVVGTGVLLRKDARGQIDRPDRMYHVWVRLSMLPISSEGPWDIKDKAEANFWIVDDSRTQVFVYDSETVYVPFELLQRLLNMEERQATRMGPEGQEQPVTVPGRTSEIQISLKPGADLNATRQKVQQVVDAVAREHNLAMFYPYRVETWEQTNAKYLGVVEKEKVLVTFLFGVISLVAVFLIFCIFYMIVVEKTRDIGIVKSVGATNSGVAGIFLGYGGAIGVVGGALGLLAGYLVVHNINQLHAWLGKVMGIQIWSPEFYQFDTIPNRMNPTETAIIVAVAIVASVVGAMVPAIRAARMNPVDSLRWE